MYWGFTDPAGGSYDPALAGQPAVPFSAILRDEAPIFQELFRMLCLIGNGLFQPAMKKKDIARNPLPFTLPFILPSILQSGTNEITKAIIPSCPLSIRLIYL